MMASGKRTGEAPPECPTPPAQPPYGEGQGTPPSSGAGPAGGKAGAGGAGDAARGGGGAPPTPLPMTGQMAPPTQPTPPLVNPVMMMYFNNKLTKPEPSARSVIIIICDENDFNYEKKNYLFNINLPVSNSSCSAY